MKHLIVGEKYREKLENPLLQIGFTPYWLPENPDVDKRLACHCDLSIFMYGKKAVLANYLKSDSLVNFLTKRGFKVLISEHMQKPRYPYDINLCALATEEYILHNYNFTDKVIKDIVSRKVIEVKQGYCRCTALPVGNGIITSDKGIYVASTAAGIDTLLICEDGIELDGFDKGFIGGSAFTADDTIYFTGDLTIHPDYRRISSYIASKGMKYRSLTADPLFDIGGAIFIQYP